MLKKYNVILFDLDGTIADTDKMIIESFNQLYDLYRNGNRTKEEEIIYFSGPSIFDTMKKEFPNVDTNLMVDRFREISTKIYPKTVKLYPGTLKMLEALKKAGYRLGIVTNKVHHASEYCLSLLNIRSYFDTLICFDDVKTGKPSPEGILKAIEELKEKDLNKVLYIGDNAIDLLSADNAKVDCALLYWGPRVLSPSLNPKYKLNNFEELTRLLINE